MAERISVVLTTFNRGYLLPQTLDSILGQTEPDFELLICDDRSTDNTRQVCEAVAEVDRRVKYLPSAQNQGMPANLNRGIERAQGEFVANLHDGDIFASNLLERWCDALAACPRAAFVFNDYMHLDPAGRPLMRWSVPLPPCAPGAELLKIFFGRWRFGSPVWGTVMARRSAYLEAGYFDERFGFLADVDMWLRLAQVHHVAYVAEALIKLPHREAVPTHISQARSVTRAHRRIVHQMLREARQRFRAEHPLIGSLEMIKHAAFATTDSSLDELFWARRVVLRLWGKRRTRT